MPRIRLLAEQVLIRHGTIGRPSENLEGIGAVERPLWKRLFRKPSEVRYYWWDKHGDWVYIVSSQEHAIPSTWIILKRKDSTRMLVLDRRGNAMIFDATGPDDSLESPSEDNYFPASEKEIEDTIDFLKMVVAKAGTSRRDS